jgi:hypothetical protein
MGGVFSGRTGQRGGKPAVESLPRVAFVARAAKARHGCDPRLALERPDLAEVSYGLSEWHVHIASTPLNFGGSRRWFVCPRCSSHRTALYVNGDALACRVCLGLRYSSQHETERDRLFRRAHKLRDQLGWGGGVGNADGCRPRGVHEKTYERLRTNLASIAEQLLTDLQDWAARAEAGMSNSHVDGV